ncbi:glycosyltransferase [Streptococcus thermophilus]|nr:glycosyltransferase [Streptococcus thermophilus]UEC17908.1 glycosyltransferase [Streptococcus thermophilus LMD-9]MBW7797999.1 glycosyltransferase [Streptococcus thermophilus]MBW7822543.1 glycosyltransferase [Streptococcus thermophilus]MBW7825886.1 glycosyltransferase [Streptococcus thermophilus]MDA3674268.1 glycosyltransferase [Streptococcus thermophilus]
MKPLLTVVIPVYNVEKYLKRCVESVLVQEWHNCKRYSFCSRLC